MDQLARELFGGEGATQRRFTAEKSFTALRDGVLSALPEV
jgi:hypothetical protein